MSNRASFLWIIALFCANHFFADVPRKIRCGELVIGAEETGKITWQKDFQTKTPLELSRPENKFANLAFFVYPGFSLGKNDYVLVDSKNREHKCLSVVSGSSLHGENRNEIINPSTMKNKMQVLALFELPKGEFIFSLRNALPTTEKIKDIQNIAILDKPSRIGSYSLTTTKTAGKGALIDNSIDNAWSAGNETIEGREIVDIEFRDGNRNCKSLQIVWGSKNDKNCRFELSYFNIEKQDWEKLNTGICNGEKVQLISFTKIISTNGLRIIFLGKIIQIADLEIK